jgi:hypothetical protein
MLPDSSASTAEFMRDKCSVASGSNTGSIKFNLSFGTKELTSSLEANGNKFIVLAISASDNEMCISVDDCFTAKSKSFSPDLGVDGLGISSALVLPDMVVVAQVDFGVDCFLEY